MAIFDIFKKKKANKEEIINVEEMMENHNKNITKQEEVIVPSKQEEKKEEVKVEENKTIDYTDTIKNFSDAKKSMNSILHEYYICKIFSRVALSENEFLAQVVELEKLIDKINNDIYDIERSIDFYKKVNNTLNEEEIRISNRVDKLLKMQKAIKQRFLDINNLYYTHLKISTVSVCINKNNDQLEKFYELINNIIKKYKNITDAAYNLYYSSGEFIVSFVNELVECISYTNNSDYINKYNYAFFLNADAIITLEIQEWIELFNKIKFAFKLISNIEIDAYLKIKEKYNYFEAIYTILMMQSEMSSKKV